MPPDVDSLWPMASRVGRAEPDEARAIEWTEGVMRSRLRPMLLAGLFTSIAFAAGAGPVSAQDTVDCARAAWAMPVETLEVPEGWAWNGVTPMSSGGVYGSLTETQVEVGATDTVPVVSFRVTCVPDAMAYLDSVQRLQESGLDAENSVVSVAPIGDRVVAWRTEAEYAGRMTIEWAHGGDLLTSVTADAEVDWTTVEDFARSLDAMLP
jgi:hypothetical protein